MKIKGLLYDRKYLIAAIEKLTGCTADYLGPPGFQYRIGACTVEKDGSLLVEDNLADPSILTNLAEIGLIEPEVSEESAPFRFPLQEMTGHSIVNLIHMIAVREKLLNKAIGILDAFYVSPVLLNQLEMDRPENIKEFQESVFLAGGIRNLVGIKITSDALYFTGFPVDSKESEVYAVLAKKMVEVSITRRWINVETEVTENEKYRFRIWLNSIGMIGTEYKEARAVLLRRLAGNTVFSTEEQKEVFNASRRKASKKQEASSDFILL